MLKLKSKNDSTFYQAMGKSAPFIIRNDAWGQFAPKTVLILIESRPYETSAAFSLETPEITILKNILEYLDNSGTDIPYTSICASVHDYTLRDLRKLIKFYKPSAVVAMGFAVFKLLYNSEYNTSLIYNSELYKRMFKCLTTESGFTLIGCTPYHHCCTQAYEEKGYANLLGLVLGTLKTLFNNETPILKHDLKASKMYTIKTMDRFHVLMRRLRAARVVALDTETTNLKVRYQPTLLTIQFSMDGQKGYFLPMFHPQTPWTPQELKEISSALVEYFTDNKNEYHIYHNAKFDIAVLRAGLKFNFYKAKLYDVMAGEFCIDENIKFVKNYYEVPAYGLEQITAKYGSLVYEQLSFKKEDRSAIASKDLDSIVEYAVIDAIATFNIHDAQLALHGESLKQFLINQFSDAIHTFSTLELNGSKIDKASLFALKAKSSSLDAEIEKMRKRFFEFPSVQKANELIIKRENYSTDTLFGRNIVFNIDKPDHRALLFFDVLQLAPTSIGKSGVGSMNKAFQRKYAATVPELKLFQEYSKAKAVYNSFVVPIFDHIVNNADCADGRIRPNYIFENVVTGRSSSTNPNLQNIPGDSGPGKLIKKLFITDPGRCFVKLDYSAHEVRMWGNNADDDMIASVFNYGLKHRLIYRYLTIKYPKAYAAWRAFVNDKDFYKQPPETQLELLASLKPKERVHNIGFTEHAIITKGDVHIQNVKLFYGLDVDKKHPLRQSIKQVIFGVMYGKGPKALAVDLYGNDSEASCRKAQDIIDLLYSKFQKGRQYMLDTIATAMGDLTVTSRIGRKRHLPACLHNSPSFKNAMARRAPNSDIQGIASDIGTQAARRAEEYIQRVFTKQGLSLQHKIINFVHDSLESECPLHIMPVFSYILEHACTTLTHKHFSKVYGFDMQIGLEVEFNFGNCLGDMYDWNYAYPELNSLFETTLKDQISRYPKFWTKTVTDNTRNAFQHNKAIVQSLRAAEVKNLIDTSNQTSILKPSQQMLLTKDVAQTLALEI